jgi:hypothetical protein
MPNCLGVDGLLGRGYFQSDVEALSVHCALSCGLCHVACGDSTTFTDAFEYGCTSWVGYDCTGIPKGYTGVCAYLWVFVVAVLSPTRQDKTRQDKTRQDKTRQDKTRQEARKHHKTRSPKTRQDNRKQSKIPVGNTHCTRPVC